jgi:hypothetical protein
MDSIYVIGGCLTFVASVLYISLSSTFGEKMMNDRMGKYLLTLQVRVCVCVWIHR